MRDRTTITMPQAVKHDIDQLAKKLNMSRSELISRIIELVMDKLNRPEVHSFEVHVPNLLQSWRA